MSFGKSDEPRSGFDKIPRWVTKDKSFPTLDPLAYKLLGYFCSVRHWSTDVTHWTTIDDLSKEIGSSWRKTKRAVLTLGTLGAIRMETERRQTRFKVIFLSPHDHSKETADQTPLRSHKSGSRLRLKATTTTAT